MSLKSMVSELYGKLANFDLVVDISKYFSTNFDDIQCTNFIFDEFSRIKIAREELLMFLDV